MKMFLFKGVFLVSLMFFSVLFGMQQANIGIQKMKGYEDPKFERALTIQATEKGELEASVLGLDVTSHDLAVKKQKLEELKAYNIFSDLGKKFSNLVRGILEELIGIFI